MRFLPLSSVVLLSAFPDLALHAQASKEGIVDLSHVPQLHETDAGREARMKWFEDAKFGMFIHWNHSSVGAKEISWQRKGNRPWDINQHGAPTVDPEYDGYRAKFDPSSLDAGGIVRLAKESGMKYIVLVAKHHDGFGMFDSKLSTNTIMFTPYGRDVVAQFAKACHEEGIRLGIYYSTRDWTHPDYLVGDNAKYDEFYRGQVEELMSKYGKVDLMWFDSVGGQDYGKWRFDKLFAMMYRINPDLIVNNRAAALIGAGPAALPKVPPVSPEIARFREGDFNTPEGRIGAMNLKKPWESCICVGQGWSFRGSQGPFKSLDDCILMLVSCVTGGGNLLLDFAPDGTGNVTPQEIAIAKGLGAFTSKYSEAIYGTRGGPFSNGSWGGSSHREKNVYVFIRNKGERELNLVALPQKVLSAKLLPGGRDVSFRQSEKGITLSIDPSFADTPYSVVKMELDQPVSERQVVGSVRSDFDDEVTFGPMITEGVTVTLSSHGGGHNFVNENVRFVTGGDLTLPWAFKTAPEAMPWVQVDLGRERNLTGMTLVNIPGEKNPAPLTVSISKDGSSWETVLESALNNDRWNIPLTSLVSGAQVPGRMARFVKIGVKNDAKPESLHLQRLEIHAKP